MLWNYLKIAWRNLYRYPGYSIVTVAGLTIGIAGALFVLLYLQDETGFDRFQANADRTYRVVETRPTPDLGDQRVAFTTGALATALVQSVPEVETTVRLVGSQALGRRTASYGDRRFYEADYLFTESSIFDVFDLRIERGNPDLALEEPGSVVLTESAASKYFGREDPMGKILTVEQFGDMRVTGIVEDPRRNSHLDFSMLFSLSTAQLHEGWAAWLESWKNAGCILYAVLRKDADPAGVQRSIDHLFTSNLGSDATARKAYLQPVSDIHFGSAEIQVERNAREGDYRYVYIFSAIGLFLVLIASINYMNMTTARSMRRAREIGMRKVAGSQRSQLIRQFLAESLLTTVLSVAIAVALVGAGLPLFNQLADKELTMHSLVDWRFAVGLALMVVFVGLVAGSYPALYLSRFRPSQILTSSPSGHAGAARLRRTLVVAQFTLSIIMITATVVVYRQLQYVQSKPLGFNENRLVVVDINNGDVRRDWKTVRSEFASVPFVQSVTTSSRVPGDWKDISEIEVRQEGGSDQDLITMHFLGVDEAFLPTYEVRLLSGRNFTPSIADSSAVLVNETAARMLGITDPSGQIVEIPEDDFRAEVVGIVEDFNFESLHTRVGPLILGYWANPVRAIDYFTARVSSNELAVVIEGLRRVGERFDPSHPFEYNVLEQRLKDFYVADRRAGTLFGCAAILAIFIACLGLAGLAAYTAERRTKEIGIRKVLGATVRGIVVMLSRDYVGLVAIAFLIAGPLAYVAMDRWLDAFAYRADVGLWVFVLSGAIALMVALGTVSVQAIRSALADPVESLRYE